MDQHDPERRIAELERQLAEENRMPEPERQQAEVVDRHVVTPEQVHNVAFTEASRSQGGYRRDEVDAFLDRVEVALRDPTATGGVTPSEIHNVAFSKPPIGTRGYSEVEVDAFLDLVKIELTRRIPGHGPEEPIRCLLFRIGGWDQQKPVLAIDMDKAAIRVIDLNSNALIASVSLAEVTATPAQHHGIPVLVVDGPGLQTMTIRARAPGTWRRRAKSMKPAFLAMDEDWLTLAEKFGVASDLWDESTPQTFFDHVRIFNKEVRRDAGPWTWRTPLAFGTLCAVAACVPPIKPILLLIGVSLLILAALFWRFKWRF
jgi:DivIVA domain-containing protein